MTRTEDQTRQLFDDWARTYDADLENARGPLIGYKGSLQAVEAGLPLQAGTHALDIGIGNGALAQRLAAQGVTITGIDISKRMLALCAENHPAFTLHEGTFNDIPLEAEAVDYVVSSFAFHEVPPEKRRDACEKMAQVLKPAGYLCLVDIMFASTPAMQAAEKLLGKAWDPNEAYAIIGELDTLLHETGFVSITWQQTAPFHWMVVARQGA